MPAQAPYIPRKQSAYDTWLLNFSTLISASPGTYGLSAGDAATISSLYSSWHGAYTPVTSPTTKTAQAVGNKNTSLVTTQSQVRVYAQQVAKNPGVTSANKIALGLNPQTSTPSPITPPTTNPVLTVQSASSGTIILRYRDSAASVSVKSKPYGVQFCQVFGRVSTTPVTVPDATSLLHSATKSPVVLNTAGLGAGATLYTWSRWLLRNGQFSAFSPIIATTVV